MKRIATAVAMCLISSMAIAQPPEQEIIKPFTIGEIRHIQSKVLGEDRTLNVYLPEGYSAGDTTRYPVIYLLDGSADEDFIHIAGLVQFANFSWVNLIPKSIVVGIANIDRKRDFTFPSKTASDKAQLPTSGGSENFITFIEQELQPYINATYKTSAKRTLIGQSLGGLVATEILYKKPYLFCDYIIVSASIWWDKESLLRVRPAVLKADFKQPVSIYIAVGHEEDVMVKDSDSMYKTLHDAGKKNLRVYLQHFEKESHATILHRAVYSAFEWMGTKSK